MWNPCATHNGEPKYTTNGDRREGKCGPQQDTIPEDLLTNPPPEALANGNDG